MRGVLGWLRWPGPLVVSVMVVALGLFLRLGVVQVLEEHGPAA
jgi:hypothetical protein